MPGTKYAGRGKARTERLPAVAVSAEELEHVELAAKADRVSVAYLIRAGALTESKKRLRRAGLLPIPKTPEAA